MYKLDDILNKIIHGDALSQLIGFPDKCVDMIMCSPPYWGLRDYKTEGVIWDGDNNCKHEFEVSHRRKATGGTKSAQVGNHKRDEIAHFDVSTKTCKLCGAWKGELGQEPTVELYTTHLVQIFDECKRVLKDEGSCWIVIGDTYNTNSGGQRINPERYDYQMVGASKARLTVNKQLSNFPQKSALMIPERFAIKMIDSGWVLRNKIVWKKGNAIPQSAKDRFTVDYEYVYFFTKKSKYYFKTQYEPHLSNSEGKRRIGNKNLLDKGQSIHSFHKPDHVFKYNKLGRIKRCVWEINTKPFPQAHFAVYPERLVEECLDAGCPFEICANCGKASETIYMETRINTRPGLNVGNAKSGTNLDPNKDFHNSDLSKYRQQIVRTESGVLRCNCNAEFKAGILLDPFLGSGTSALVALKNNRNFIGIEPNQDYINMAMERIKPYLNNIIIGGDVICH